MLTDAQQYKEYFEQDEDLLNILTGGIWTWEETGRLGINYTNIPLAFEGAYLKPCALVKTRQIMPTSALRDEAEQVMSYERTCQIFIYQEGGTGKLEDAYNLLYNLIQDKSPFTGVRTMITNIIEGIQEESLNGANVIRIDFKEFGFKKPEDPDE